MSESNAYLYRLWDEGQRHLAAGRYGAARGALEGAEALAWRGRDARSLARIYLPLLEVRRLMRYQAAEGKVVICDGEMQRSKGLNKWVGEFSQEEAGTVVLAAGRDLGKAVQAVNAVKMAARRTGRSLEALVLVEHGSHVRVVAAKDPRFAAGLAVVWTRDDKAAVGESTDAELVLPLPPAGEYEGKARGLGAMARESLVIAWEALALRWQGRHALAAQAGAWEEMGWLREALCVDPACEPVTMRLIALAEGVQRGG